MTEKIGQGLQLEQSATKTWRRCKGCAFFVCVFSCVLGLAYAATFF